MQLQSTVKMIAKGKMSRIIGLRAILGGMAVAAVLLLGCGGSTRNDQGSSFMLTGFYADTSGSFDGFDEATGATSYSLAYSALDFDAARPADEEGFVDGSGFGQIGLLNALTGQTIRVDRAFIAYEIPGSGVSVPSTSTSLGVVLGPYPGGTAVNDGTFGNPDSDLPDHLQNENVGQQGGIPNEVLAAIKLVPTDVRQYLSLQRASLPEPPFIIVATVQVLGRTSGGDELWTNQASIDIVVTPDNIIPPSAGDESNTGSVEIADEF